MTRIACLALGLCLAGGAAGSEIYRWVDGKGETHYTDDPSTIPADRRAKAEKTQGGNVTVGGSGARPNAVVAPDPEIGPEGERPTPPSEEDVWRARFREINEKLRKLRDQVDKDRAVVEDPGAHGVPISAYVRGVLVTNPEIAKIKERLDQEQAELDAAVAEQKDLDRKATFAGIPRAWRR